MILVSTKMYARHTGVPRKYFRYALWVKFKMPSICARLIYKLISFSTEWTQIPLILVSNLGFSGVPDIVGWLENTLDITLWVKYKLVISSIRPL